MHEVRLAVTLLALIACGCSEPETAGTASCTLDSEVLGDATADTDSDGFTDQQEINSLPGSNPCSALDTPDSPLDSDNDGCSDFDEDTFGFCDGNPNSGSSQGGGSSNSNTFSLDVRRHEDQSFNGSSVDFVFEKASELMQNEDLGCGDVATNITFLRSGQVQTFSTGSAIITTESQLDALFDLPGDIKIVNQLFTCGGTAGNSTILGCAISGQSAIVISRADPDVWAHEWGHVLGLGHRDSCPGNLMHSFEANTDSVNQSESNTFLNSNRSTLAARKFARPKGDGLAGLIRRNDESSEQWLERLVTRRYLGGIPNEAGAELQDQDVQQLVTWMEQRTYANWQSNVIRAIGLSGRGVFVEVLLEHIGDQSGELSPEGLQELAEMFFAVGRLAASDDSGTGLSWLIEMSTPDAWAAASDGSCCYEQLTNDELHDLLARFAIMGLAASGMPEALDYLLERQVQMERQGAQQGLLDTQVSEAIEQLQQVGRFAPAAAVDRIP